MDPIKLGSGDNNNAQSLNSTSFGGNKDDISKLPENFIEPSEDVQPLDKKFSSETITIQSIEDHENKLKSRISDCRNIIEALKVELSEEKAKIERETKNQQLSYEAQTQSLTYKSQTSGPMMSYATRKFDVPITDAFLGDYGLNSNVYSACVDSKLNCDENLMEYEKQLEQYQTTLNMAQLEKKNAIRKQMLTKAYRLKLLEIENQCNIELLRVKQSLQCLEPLKMIAGKWNTDSDESQNVDNYELMPSFPEFNSVIGTHLFNDAEGGKENALDAADDKIASE